MLYCAKLWIYDLIILNCIHPLYIVFYVFQQKLGPNTLRNTKYQDGRYRLRIFYSHQMTPITKGALKSFASQKQ